MIDCGCNRTHDLRRVVLTGGPGAGKTAVLELVHQYFCRHVEVLPEAAGIVFGGGFPRRATSGARRAAQRAIFQVQHELENLADEAPDAIVLCDRGTLDGLAYWPGPGDLCDELGTTRAEQMQRYHAVIHMRTPTPALGYHQGNPLRIESASEAAVVDEAILRVWEGHPRRHLVPPAADFLVKGAQVIGILASYLPDCCRARVALPDPAHERAPRADAPGS